jgi:hypothetical protein
MGIEYVSPVNTREHLDKVKSQIGFCETVYLPLSEEMAAFDEWLYRNVAQVTSNFSALKWTHPEVSTTSVEAIVSSPLR